MWARGCGFFCWGWGSAARNTVLAACVAVSACGGESRRTVDEAPSSEPSDMPAEPAPSDTAQPPLSPEPIACASELELDVDPRMTAPSAADGVTVELLQAQASWNTELPPSGAIPDENSDPSTWDRSALPAGACVFRIYGMDGLHCYPSGGTFFTGSCAALNSDGVNVAPGSYYDSGYECTTAPGCPSADGYPEPIGYWWYFSESGFDLERRQDFTDLVICAPECANSFPRGGCLRLWTPAFTPCSHP